MIDLHCHIIPEVDDGPRDMDEALDILRVLSGLGFTHLFATPHHRWLSWNGLDSELVISGVRDLTERARGGGIDLRLFPGMEYDLDGDIVERVQGRPHESGFVLVDPGFYRSPFDIPDLIGPLLTAGVKVVMVHPERNDYLCRDLNGLRSLRSAGVLFLGNIGSFGEMYGRKIRANSRRVLDDGLYWALATDIHHAHQAVYIEKGLDDIGRWVGGADKARLLKGNPMLVVKQMEERIEKLTD